MTLRNKYPLGLKLLLVAVIYASYGFLYYRGHQLKKSWMFENEDLLFASPLMLVLLFVANFGVLWMHDKTVGVTVKNVFPVAMQSLAIVLGTLFLVGLVLVNLYGE
jgi:hypothetical protein